MKGPSVFAYARSNLKQEPEIFQLDILYDMQPSGESARPVIHAELTINWLMDRKTRLKDWWKLKPISIQLDILYDMQPSGASARPVIHAELTINWLIDRKKRLKDWWKLKMISIQLDILYDMKPLKKVHTLLLTLNWPLIDWSEHIWLANKN